MEGADRFRDRNKIPRGLPAASADTDAEEGPVYGYIEGDGSEDFEDEDAGDMEHSQPTDHPNYPRISYARAGPNTQLAKDVLAQLLQLNPSSFGCNETFDLSAIGQRLPRPRFSEQEVHTRADYRVNRIPLLVAETLEGIKSSFLENPLWVRQVRFWGEYKRVQQPTTDPPLFELRCSFAAAKSECGKLAELRSNSLVLLHLPATELGDGHPRRANFKIGSGNLRNMVILGHIKSFSVDQEQAPRGKNEPFWPTAKGTLPMPGTPVVRMVLTIRFVLEGRNKENYSREALSRFVALCQEVQPPEFIEPNWRKSINLEMTFLGKLHQFFRMVRMLSLPDRPADLDNDYNVSPLLDLMINPNREWACPPPPAAPPVKRPRQLLDYVISTDRPSISAILGGPGTGKSTMIADTVLERLQEAPYIRNDTDRRLQFLLITPSNAAANVLTKKFWTRIAHHKWKVTVRRVGEVSKFTSTIRELMAKDLKAWMENRPPGEDWNLHEARFITDADVIITTAGSAQSQVLAQNRSALVASVIIIDEAGQGSEAELLLPLYLISLKHLILVGDGAQLGPTIISRQLQSYPLADVSLFARLQSSIFTIALNPQRRMRPLVAQMVSNLAYNSARHPLETRPWANLSRHLNDRTFLLPPLMVFSGSDWYETRERNSTSFANPNEAAFVMLLLESCLSLCDVDLQNKQFRGPQSPQLHFGLISLYKKQVNALQQLVDRSGLDGALHHLKITVGTVDSMQGHAFDVCIVSSVRASANQGVGFAHILNRLNVAISRGTTLFLLAHYLTFSLEPGWNQLFATAAEYGLLELDAQFLDRNALTARLTAARNANLDVDFAKRRR